MFELPDDLPSELVPLSWLIGSWSGSGVVAFAAPEGGFAEPAPAAGALEYEFEQRISFVPEGTSVLRYDSETRRLDDGRPVSSERGYWRLLRPARSFDAGPGLIAGVGDTSFTSAQSVESLRTDAGVFEVEAVIVHPDGIAELYLGTVDGPRIELATDAVLRPAAAREYSGATRMLGLVDGHLLWAWDAAALGAPLQSLASARLARD